MVVGHCCAGKGSAAGIGGTGITPVHDIAHLMVFQTLKLKPYPDKKSLLILRRRRPHQSHRLQIPLPDRLGR